MEEKEGEKRICVFLCWSQSLPRTPQGMTSKRVEEDGGGGGGDESGDIFFGRKKREQNSCRGRISKTTKMELLPCGLCAQHTVCRYTLGPRLLPGIKRKYAVKKCSPFQASNKDSTRRFPASLFYPPFGVLLHLILHEYLCPRRLAPPGQVIGTVTLHFSRLFLWRDATQIAEAERGGGRLRLMGRRPPARLYFRPPKNLLSLPTQRRSRRKV